MNIPAHIKGIIFDLDGTLVDSLPVHREGFINASKEQRLEADVAFLQKHTGKPTEIILELLAKEQDIEIDISQFLAYIESHFRSSIEQVKKNQPVYEFLLNAHSNYPCSIGTGSQRWATDLMLQQLDLTTYFDVVVTANDVTQHKPHAETFLKCADSMGVSPEACLVLEDGQVGIEAALSASMLPFDVVKWEYVKAN